MKVVYRIMLHLSCVLAIAMIVYFILDRFNPLLQFINNGTTKLLLLAFAVITLVANEITLWKVMDGVKWKKGRKKSEETAAAGRKDMFSDGNIEEI